MSRPQFFNAFRSAFSRRPRSGAFASPLGPLGFGQRAGTGPFPNTFGARGVSGVVSTSTRSTLFRPVTMILLIAPLLTGYLGVWQIQRLKWKLALIDEVDANLAKEPIALPARVNLGALPDFAFRRVLIKGHFVGPPILQGPQTRDGIAGYHLILPFDRSAEGGSTVLVNQGFVLTAEGDAIREGTKPVPGLGPNGSPGPETVIEGMITKTEPGTKSFFVPKNEPERNQWYWKDVPEMAEWVGGEEKGVQNLLVDAIDHGETPASMLMHHGQPVGRPLSIELRNQHMTYAITWFSLCIATSIMLGLVIKRGRVKKLPGRKRALHER